MDIVVINIENPMLFFVFIEFNILNNKTKYIKLLSESVFSFIIPMIIDINIILIVAIINLISNFILLFIIFEKVKYVHMLIKNIFII